MKKTLLILLTLFVLILSACAQQQVPQQPSGGEVKPAQQGSYKIGVMYPLTGDGAAYGLPIIKESRRFIWVGDEII